MMVLSTSLPKSPLGMIKPSLLLALSKNVLLTFQALKMKSSSDYLSVSLGTAVPKCSVSDMDEAFLEKLLFAQKLAGKKFRINSAFRSKAYEKEKGRSGRSAHCLGLAVDISTADSKTRYIVVAALLGAGFNRIGIGKNFVHVDDDLNRVHPVIFTYYE